MILNHIFFPIDDIFRILSELFFSNTNGRVHLDNHHSYRKDEIKTILNTISRSNAATSGKNEKLKDH